MKPRRTPRSVLSPFSAFAADFQVLDEGWDEIAEGELFEPDDEDSPARARRRPHLDELDGDE